MYFLLFFKCVVLSLEHSFWNTPSKINSCPTPFIFQFSRYLLSTYYLPNIGWSTEDICFATISKKHIFICIKKIKSPHSPWCNKMKTNILDASLNNNYLYIKILVWYLFEKLVFKFFSDLHCLENEHVYQWRKTSS